MITRFPPEIASSIFSELNIQSLHAVQLVSKVCNDIVKANESKIYHNAAVTHGFILSIATAIDQLEAAGISKNITFGMEKSWKSFCRRMFQLDRNWEGNGPSELTCFPSTGEKPEFVKVDETDGLVINITDIEGDDSGVIVVDKDDKVLWSQTWDFMQSNTVDYQCGYLVFDNTEKGYKEIWRLATIEDPLPPANAAIAAAYPYPQPKQVSLSKKAFKQHKRTYPQGHFIPHAAIPVPGRHCFRLRYPELILMESDDVAHIYDVRTRERLRSIGPLARPTVQLPSGDLALSNIGRIMNVDMTSRYVFCAGHQTGMRVFDKETSICVLDIPGGKKSYGGRRFKIGKPKTTVVKEMDGMITPVEISEVSRDSKSQLHFDKVCVSLSGNHLLALTRASEGSQGQRGCELVVIRHFTEIPFGSEQQLSKRTIQLDFEARYGSLAFDGHRRALVVLEQGVFIVDVSEFLASAGDLKVFNVPAFRGTTWTCTSEITRTGIYFDWEHEDIKWAKWDKRRKRKHVRREYPDSGTICGVDFAVWD